MTDLKDLDSAQHMSDSQTSVIRQINGYDKYLRILFITVMYISCNMYLTIEMYMYYVRSFET